MDDSKLDSQGAQLDKESIEEPCQPREWQRENICDVSILTYRYNVVSGNHPVECALRFRVVRCTEGYVLSDLLHSTTLFPGEEVLLSTRTRHSIARFTEDKSFTASQLSHSSDAVWMETFNNLATDFNETTSRIINADSHSKYERDRHYKGDVHIWGSYVTLDTHAEGFFDASSSVDFNGELFRHLESSLHKTNQITRDTSSVNVTEVNSHREATSEKDDELKVSTRRFRNINTCHTVTHYFYQIAKRQRVTISLISVNCRAVNAHAHTAVRMKNLTMSHAANFQLNIDRPVVAPTPGALPATAATAFPAPQSQLNTPSLTIDQINLRKLAGVNVAALAEEEKARVEAVKRVRAIIEQQRPNFEVGHIAIIPTEAVYVESELGRCMICEPYVVEKQRLELERLRLENEKLKRETELLEKYKDYRCCEGEMSTNVMEEGRKEAAKGE